MSFSLGTIPHRDRCVGFLLPLSLVRNSMRGRRGEEEEEEDTYLPLPTIPLGAVAVESASEKQSLKASEHADPRARAGWRAQTA